MGSCISKFGPKRKKIKKQCCKDCSQIFHDKLVIPKVSLSATATPPLLPIEIEKRVSSLPSAAAASSNASFSSFSMTSSLSSTSSCSSSISINKDRSFSSEFLKSCVKKNPHIISQNLVQKGSSSLEKSRNPTKMNHPPFPQKPHLAAASAAAKQETEEKHGGGGSSSTPKKRIRSNSPTIIRQKSFRKEPNWNLRSPSPNRTFSTEPSWNLRSPSPSRRFSGGDQSLKDSILKAKIENYNKRGVISKASMHNPQTSSLKKQSFRGSPVNQIHQLKSIKGRYNPQMNSKIDEYEGEEDKDKLNQDTEMIVEEDDINNPQIALDCFIFL